MTDNKQYRQIRQERELAGYRGLLCLSCGNAAGGRVDCFHGTCLFGTLCPGGKYRKKGIIKRKATFILPAVGAGRNGSPFSAVRGIRLPKSGWKGRNGRTDSLAAKIAYEYFIEERL